MFFTRLVCFFLLESKKEKEKKEQQPVCFEETLRRFFVMCFDAVQY